MSDVAKQTGIPATTLRAWERRYGFPIPQRTAGGHRRYVAADVAALETAHALLEQGWNAGSAVRHVREISATGEHQQDADVMIDVRTPDSVAPNAAPTGVDVDALVQLARVLRDLLRTSDVTAVPSVIIGFVERLGGRVIPAENDDGSALPVDVSLGVMDPLLATAEPFTLARMRLESMLPELVQDAQIVIDRLRLSR